MNKLFRILLVIALAHCPTFAGNIHIGAGRDFPTIEAACPTLKPGDSVFVHSGTYDTYQYYLGLKGTPGKWITITKAPNETVEINGGWQFTSSEYIRIEKLVFKTNAKYNNTLLHFDHAGDCTKLSNHIIIDSCSFLDVAGGNTFKLGGVSDFEVSNCRFVNNTSGFAGIALNESRNGVIRNCYFENIKTKGIQFKLGTMNVVVYGNYFKNAGLDDSALKIGESGGKEFYCPDAKDWHAKDIKIYSNIFVGGKTPFSIGLAINSEITNNTIVAPATFVVRLLSDEAEYENKNNTFTNNLFYLDKTIYFNGSSAAKNIDFPSIVFQNNLFYSVSKPTWTGPNPNGGDYDAEEIKGVQFINSTIANPLLKDVANADFNLSDKSPALGAGMAVQSPMLDYFGNPFRQQRCIGAIETGSVQSIINVVSVGLNMTNATMNLGDSLPLVATVAPQNATNKSLRWNTSQPSIASVSNAGVVKALSAGTAEITVTTVDGNFKAKCMVLVTNPIVAVQSITLNTNTASMRTGDSLQLTASILPQNASNKSVTWLSATSTIATVSSNGMVKALSAGKVDIAATTIDGGYKATCTIQVTNPSGVDEKALSGHILLSPNPVNDELQFTLPHPSPFDMEIFSAIGVRVLQANTSRINIEHLSSGMYWVRIRQGSKVYYGSFVKK